MALPKSKIKSDYHQKVVAFGKSALPLGKRDDIDDLAIIAHESGDPTILDLFDVLPALDDLKKAKTDSELPVITVSKKESKSNQAVS